MKNVTLTIFHTDHINKKLYITKNVLDALHEGCPEILRKYNSKKIMYGGYEEVIVPTARQLMELMATQPLTKIEASLIKEYV